MGMYRVRPLHEQLTRLDLRRIRKAGLLKPGTFGWQWNRHGDGYAAMVMRFTDHMAMQHSIPSEATLERLRDAEGNAAESEPLTHWIGLEGRECRYGGRRYWMLCPKCDSRRDVLYWGGRRFICRACAGVGYAIENMGAQERADLTIQRLEPRMAEDGTKPKRMRQRTWERLLDRHNRAMDRFNDLDILRLAARFPEYFAELDS